MISRKKRPALLRFSRGNGFEIANHWVIFLSSPSLLVNNRSLVKIEGTDSPMRQCVGKNNYLSTTPLPSSHPNGREDASKRDLTSMSQRSKRHGADLPGTSPSRVDCKRKGKQRYQRGHAQPPISVAVPQLSPLLSSYVSWNQEIYGEGEAAPGLIKLSAKFCPKKPTKKPRNNPPQKSSIEIIC